MYDILFFTITKFANRYGALGVRVMVLNATFNNVSVIS